MNRKILKDILLRYGYSVPAAYSILQGTRRPRYEVMVALDKDGVVPFDAWIDIRSYLNDNAKEGKGSNTKEGERV